MHKAIFPHVSAGGQPLASDLEKLKNEGVTTVVHLRLEEEESPLTPAEEGSLAEKLDLDYHHLLVSLDKLDAAQV